MGGDSGTGVAELAAFTGFAMTLLKVDSASRATVAIEFISHEVRHEGNAVEVLT